VQSAQILRQDGLILSSVEYYNCTRLEGRMTKEEEMRMLLTCLEQEDFWVQVNCKYHSSNSGERKRIVGTLFFCSSEQIRLGQRFVSQFLIETDATFNTNSLYLPLSVVIGITNTGKIFPLAYTWITSESVEAFQFIQDQLDDVIFHNCHGLKVVLEDHSKGLIKAMGDAITQDSAIKAIRGPLKTQPFLQLCSWHAAKAIRKRLADTGYLKERREELTSYIWDYIKSSTKAELETNQQDLLNQVKPSDQVYLDRNWIPIKR
jgi:hypothetical protein